MYAVRFEKLTIDRTFRGTSFTEKEMEIEEDTEVMSGMIRDGDAQHANGTANAIKGATKPFIQIALRRRDALSLDSLQRSPEGAHHSASTSTFAATSEKKLC